MSCGGETQSNHTMIKIKPSKTADTRSCDFANVSKELLLASSLQHIGDVGKALAYFGTILTHKASVHDYDKLTTIDWFHSDFTGGFKETGWWDNHRRIHRHHLAQEDGVPNNVNLLDLLEYIADCVMAGKARTGEVFPLVITDEILRRAFDNTVELLKGEVEVVTESNEPPWLQRLRQEHSELEGRLTRLADFMASLQFADLPEPQRSLMVNQRIEMQTLLITLENRIILAGN